MKKTSVLIVLGLIAAAAAHAEDGAVFDSIPASGPGATVIPAAPVTPVSGCGAFDPDCRRRLARILGGVQIVPIEVTGGFRIDEGGPSGAVRFGLNVGAVDVPVGDLRVLPFEAIYIPEAGGFRIRVSLVDSQVLFFCKDENNPDSGVSLGLFKALMGTPPNCRPDGIVGVGGSVANINWDTATKRVAARWAEINLVLNMFANGNGSDYLRKHLNAFIGASVDTVWLGNTPNTSGGVDTMARLNVGIQGMVRSDDNHWELRGAVAYRPNVIAWDDYAIEVKAQVMYHFLFNQSLMGTVGLDAEYQRWSVPSHSIGSFASDRERDSFFIGLMFGITWRGPG